MAVITDSVNSGASGSGSDMTINSGNKQQKELNSFPLLFIFPFSFRLFLHHLQQKILIRVFKYIGQLRDQKHLNIGFMLVQFG